jgi:pyruvate kinase
MNRTRTKIIATIGADGRNSEYIRRLIGAGMNVARLNCSHMASDDARPIVSLLKQIRSELGVPLAIMLDTRGPEVRIFGYNKPMQVFEGSRVIIRSYAGPDIDTIESATCLYTNLQTIGAITSVGGRALFMDGAAEGEIVSREEDSIVVEFKNAAELRPKAHMSLPKTDYPLPFLSTKDEQDIRYAVLDEVDFIALSFVRSAEDIFRVRNIIHETDNASRIRIVAKIETQRAIDNLQQIIRYSDGVIIARGDLGVELDIEDVPIRQKQIIECCMAEGKPAITATQMLESMIESRFPTRAEVSDVANACYDMGSAVTLSGETAIGKYPDLALTMMRRIIDRVESNLDYERAFHQRQQLTQSRDLTTVISYNAVSTAYQCNAAAIIVFTKTGYSARMICKLRPRMPIYAFTPDDAVYQQLALSWGVFPQYIVEHGDFETMLKEGLEYGVSRGFFKRGDLVVIVAGLPMGASGRTNMIRVEPVGKCRIPVKVAHPGQVTGQVAHITNEADFERQDLTGKILLLKLFKVEFTARLRYAAAIVTENDDWEEDLRVLGIACNIPVFVNARAALDLLPLNAMVQLDSDRELLIEV